jgi:hypothetical protein
MTRKLALVVGVLLGSVPAAGLLAQTPAAKPNPSSGMQHATSVKPAQQDSAASKSDAKTHHAAWTKDQITEAQAGLAKAGYFTLPYAYLLNPDLSDDMWLIKAVAA